ncbi:MAG: FAD-dependent oxidoreductase [Bacteroidales bacterium]
MAIVKKYPAEVVHIEQPIKDIFTLQMKSLGGSFKYAPGQFLHFALDEYDPSSGWPESRCFSMQSSAKDELIKITYAVKGCFTKRMATELMAGSLVTLKLPYGDLFTQEHCKEKTVFIAGGTGITPFLSLFTDPDFAFYKNPVLFAGFQNKELNLYHEELKIAMQINPSLIINYIYQDKQGILDIAKILNKSDSKSSFFISGPPEMIKTFKKYLIQQKIHESQIKTDDWE